MRLERPDFCTYMKARSFIPKAPKLRDFCTSFAMSEQHFHVWIETCDSEIGEQGVRNITDIFNPVNPNPCNHLIQPL